MNSSMPFDPSERTDVPADFDLQQRLKQSEYQLRQCEEECKRLYAELERSTADVLCLRQAFKALVGIL